MNCPNCGSDDATLLGQLSATPWVRCRACGTTYSVSATEIQEILDDYTEAT